MRTNPADREEDAAYTFGYHPVVHCRDEGMATLPADASPEMKAAVQKAVDTALHNANDMLEGFWKLDAGPEHTIELALVVRVHDPKRQVVEKLEISPFLANWTFQSATGNGRKTAIERTLVPLPGAGGTRHLVHV